MAFGFSTFAADGSPLLTVSGRLLRLHAQANVTLSPYEVRRIAVPGLVPDGSWFVVAANLLACIEPGYIVLVNTGGSSQTDTYALLRL